MAQFIKNKQGESLTLALIGTALIGLSFTALISMIRVQQKEGTTLVQQLTNESLKYEILQTLKNPEVCKCQFNEQNFNDEELTLADFTNGCNSDSRVIAKPGQTLSPGMTVRSVKVSDVRETGFRTPNFVDINNPTNNIDERIEHLGNLIVAYQGEGSSAHRMFVDIPIQFMVDSSGSILECGADTGLVVELRQIDLDINNRFASQKTDMDALQDRLGNHEHLAHEHPPTDHGSGSSTTTIRSSSSVDGLLDNRPPSSKEEEEDSPHALEEEEEDSPHASEEEGAL